MTSETIDVSSPVEPAAVPAPSNEGRSFFTRTWRVCRRWFDTSDDLADASPDVRRVDWIRCSPFLAMHLVCFAVIWVGWSPVAVLTAVALYLIRMFAITGFYHRYFSHRTFKTSRWFQFVMAIWGSTAVQRGPLWWAAHHRHHHKYSDEEKDAHSVRQHGFWWAHMGWFTSKSNFHTKSEYVQDLERYPELVWINRFDIVVPLIMATGLFGAGWWLGRTFPSLGVTGMQMLIWGFFISTIVLAHATYTINSLSHVFGRRRFKTSDDSRNNLGLALLTLGEGWHNNHHHYPHSTRQGFFWWEVDITYYGLVVMSWLGLVWNLRPVPQHSKHPPAG